ncbi:hypothetical protein PAXRUDRAFT_824782 [Paxillus rubicundulus Ve08.2h10]|uniref:Uncharacterized protein n=1 Tax=Paxillus rubicundulus Ve08.2h10 TaxID=930991 RepID=A0A0D0DTZ9_9AGAM|nr:hypothetical protein PAXRUDRAFT_824782 [Paxillus rubicundulus Ve08.2h10]
MQLSPLALLLAFIGSAAALPMAPAADLLGRSPVQGRSTGGPSTGAPDWKRGSGGISSPGWKRETTDFSIPA